jgi:hypothetical protein
MLTLIERIRKFESDQQTASEHMAELAAAEPDMSAEELEDAYYARLRELSAAAIQELNDRTEQYFDQLFKNDVKVNEVA